MKNVILFVSVFFFTALIYAQESGKTSVTNLKSIEFKDFYANGALKTLGHFDVAGKLNGPWTAYDQNGNITTQGVFENGAKVGTWLYWQGNKLVEVNFKANKVKSHKKWISDEYIAVH